jgi:hypothetical protein
VNAYSKKNEESMDQTKKGDDHQPKSGARKRMLTLDDKLVRAAGEALGSGGEPLPTTRRVFALAVDRYLPVVIERLLAAGLVPSPGSTRRPRNIDIKTWDHLAKATGLVAVGQNELLRCCVNLAARREESPTSKAGERKVGTSQRKRR